MKRRGRLTAVVRFLGAWFPYFHEGAWGCLAFVTLGLALDLLSLPPGPLPFLVFAADAPFLWLLWWRGGIRWKRWALLYGALHFGFAARWLSEIHAVQVLGTAIILAPIYVLLGGAIRALVRRGAPLALTVGVCVVLEEMLRTVWCGGMPWPSRALPFAGDAWLGGSMALLLPAASFLGAYAFSFVAGMTSAVVSAIPAWLGQREPGQGARLLKAALAPFVLLLALAVAAGMRRGQYDDHTAAAEAAGQGDTGLMLVVQADIAQSLKYSGDPDQVRKLFDRHMRLTQEGLAALPEGERAFAILWPETMIPWNFLGPELTPRFPRVWSDQVGVMRRIRTDVPEARDLAWLVGVIHHFRRGEERHTLPWFYGTHDSLYHLDPRQMPDMDAPRPAPVPGEDPPWEVARYDKRMLVPFGEYTPGGDYIPGLRWLRNRVSPIPELDPGAEDQAPFVLDPGPRAPDGSGSGSEVKAGGIICFEIGFPPYCRAWRRRGARVLLNASNYGWFGRTGFRDQVQAVARLRAAEFAVCIVMAGNTGPTAFYDPLGRRYGTFQASGGRKRPAGGPGTTHREGWTWGALRLDRGGETPYTRWGDVPWYGLSFLLLAWTLLRGRRRASPV